MSIYKIYFKWKDKDVMLQAKGLDMTHPYFVSITGIVMPEKSKLIIDPSDDEIRKTFGNSTHLMIPFQTVTLIEETNETPHSDEKIKPFVLLDDKEKKKGKKARAEDDDNEDNEDTDS
ncbi:MAG: DUF1820 family protein [Spirochaetaceae bacterium]|nr:MAG: DUF1820 family protein [Spirochaetaceae bacterium]